MKTGDIVISTRGHDMGEWYIVENTLGSYVFLIDGKARPVSSPKQKNVKHIVKTNYFAEEIATKIKHRQKVYDADVQKTLKFFKKQS